MTSCREKEMNDMMRRFGLLIMMVQRSGMTSEILSLIPTHNTPSPTTSAGLLGPQKMSTSGTGSGHGTPILTIHGPLTTSQAGYKKILTMNGNGSKLTRADSM